MIKKPSVETLKKSIVTAIGAGCHETQLIIAYTCAEFAYENFCKAIAQLQCKGVVEYISGKGYFLV